MLRSVLDIDVNDEKFKAFQVLFEKYQGQLQKIPGAWAGIDKSIKSSFETATAALLAQAELTRKIAQEQRKSDAAARRAGHTWLNMARSTRDVASNISRATVSLLKWAGLTTVFSGLLGAGGLFGIDRLAGAVSASRRSSLGLGIGYGQQKAFEVNYGRLVEPNSFLAAVNEALTDVTKRRSLYGAGLNEGDLRGRNTGQVASALLPHLKTIADQTPTALLGQVLQARGLDQFVTVQDLQRLRAIPRTEMAQFAAQYARDARAFGLDNQAQKDWQDFSVQMMRAGQNIENVFVKGLRPLTPALSQLSDSVSRAVKSLLTSQKIKEWIADFGHGIEGAAKYIGSEKFQTDMRDFAEDVEAVAKALGNALRWLGIIPRHSSAPAQPKPKWNTPFGPVQYDGKYGEVPNFPSWMTDNRNASGRPLKIFDSSTWGTARPHNNPGNMRRPGRSTGFASFATMDDGLRAMARQLAIYQRHDHLSTISQIVSKWAPSSENNTASYIADVARRSGFKANQPLDLSNEVTLSKVISAMTKHENSKSNFSAGDVAKALGAGARKLEPVRTTPRVTVDVRNNTGGNAIIQTSQVAQ